MRPSLLTLGLLVACGPATEPTVDVEPMTWEAEAGDPPGLARFVRWTDDVAQGARPRGEEGLKTLAALGFKTILCVDGAPPDAGTARRYKMRTVHVPLGFGKVDTEGIVATVRKTKGPLYVHDADGGPRALAAAMIVRRELEGLSTDEAIRAAHGVGDLRRYGGLLVAVTGFKSPERANHDLPEAVEPRALQAKMIEIDRSWQNLTRAKATNWSGWPRAEALALAEHFTADDPKLSRGMHDAQLTARMLALALHDTNAEKADRAYRRLQENCTRCHAQHRR
ncbi:MAG: hypothetical protein ACYTHK_18440 [Planctomycetota bacterium]|jgi:hypothetical protein